MAKINGANTPDAAGMTVMQYLISAGYSPKLVAVELNGQILPKTNYADSVILDSDTLEIVTFVGGG